MGIDDYFLVLILVAGFVLSGFQKLIERMKANRKALDDRNSDPRGNAGDTIRTAQRRAAPEHPATPQPAKIEDLVRRLMGEENAPTLEGPFTENEEAAESNWTPLSPPPLRRAPPIPQRIPEARTPATPPRQMYQPPQRRQMPMPQRPAPQQGPSQGPRAAQPPRPAVPPSRQRPSAAPANRTGPQRTARENEELLPVEIEQRENERRWREEMERRKKLQAAQEAQQAKQRAPEVLHVRPRLQRTRGRLFHNAGEVRRAIILSEVLGPPRAMRDLEERA